MSDWSENPLRKGQRADEIQNISDIKQKSIGHRVWVHADQQHDNAGCVDVEVTADDLTRIDGLLKKYPNIGLRYSANENKFIKKQD